MMDNERGESKINFRKEEGEAVSHPTLEERVATLEKQMAELKAHHANGAQDKPWLSTLGFFAGDTGMKEIFDEALKLREKDREKARRRQGKKSTSRRVKK